MNTNQTDGKNTQTVLTVLIVDDIPENLDLLEDVLQEKGYQVLTAKSGQEALQIIEKEKVHVIVADAMMPRMDGLELCRQIRSQMPGARIPFVIYTGNYVDKEDEELARGIGVDKYVMKYAGVDVLVDAVDELTKYRYGYEPEAAKEESPRIDDHSFLERHHDIVTKKLEEKMHELQLYAETLARKNRELAASESRYRGLFENASVAIFVLDTVTRRIIDVNKQGITLLGYSREEVLELPALPFIGELEGIPDVFNAVRIVSREYAMKTKFGDVLQVDISAGPVTRPDDRPDTMLFIRDITEQKRMRDQLMQSEKMSTMGHIAAGIAHEIRNPLAGISLNLQFLERREHLDALERESILAALEGTNRIQQVIEDTLGLARVTPPSLREYSVNTIVEKAVLYLKLSARQKDLTIHSQLDQALPRIFVDVNQIQQVMLNILQNAIDATPARGKIQVRSDLFRNDSSGATTGSRFVRILIHDSGPGLHPDIAAHLFEPFRTTKTDGTGLGLMLSKYIIDRHQGNITLANDTQGGVVAQVLLPVPPILSEERHE